MKEEIECANVASADNGSSSSFDSLGVVMKNSKDERGGCGDSFSKDSSPSASSPGRDEEITNKLSSGSSSSTSTPSSLLSTSFDGNNSSMTVQQRLGNGIHNTEEPTQLSILESSKQRTEYPDRKLSDKNGKKYVNNHDHVEERNTLRKLYIKYFRNVFLADDDDQLKYQMKIRAAEEQYKTLILLGTGLNLIISICYVEWNYIRQVNFFSLCLMDTFLDIAVQLMLILCGVTKDLPTLELAHIFKNVILGSVRAINQIYSGFYSPIWVMNGFALLIFSHVAFFRNSLSLISCVILIFSSIIGQYAAFRLMFSEVERGGRFMTLTHIERQTPHMQFIPNTSIYLQTILQNTMIQVFILSLGVMFSRDVEEQYSRSIRFEYQIKTERFLNASKTKFIGNLSHEMRNPLHGMIGIIEILKIEIKKIIDTLSQTDFNKNETREPVIKDVISASESNIDLIDDIHSNARMLLNIFSNSLQISSLELGQLKLNYNQFNILEMSDSIISVFSTIARDKGLVLQSYFDVEKVPIILKADSVRLSQILINIVSNSVKYTRSGKVIFTCGTIDRSDSDFPFEEERISLDLGEAEAIEEDNICFLKIECKDTGIGIAPDQLEKLFEPFHIVEEKTVKQNVEFDRYYSQSVVNTNNSFNDRHGLGLSISHKLIQLMKGKIIVKSKVNEGTTITLYIPTIKIPKEESQKYCECLHIKVNELEKSDVREVLILDDDDGVKDILNKYCSFVFKKPIREISTEKDAIDFFNTPNHITNYLILYNSNKFSSPFFMNIDVKENTIIQLCSRSKTSNVNSNTLYLPFKFEKFINILHNNIVVKHKDKREDKSFHIEKIAKGAKRALVVDDNDVNRKVLQKLMTLLGFEVETAADGLEAFEMVKKTQNPYDIILMDLLMPVLCGKESCKLMRDLKCSSKIIAVTANIWESLDTIQQAGFDSVLRKPVMLNDLRKELAKYLDNE